MSRVTDYDHDSPIGRMHAAASRARARLLGTAGDGSVLENIELDPWSDDLPLQRADDIAGLLSALTEHCRHVREVARMARSGDDLVESRSRAFSDMLNKTLPLNRKERYYTGTVLPMIVASEGFSHLGRLLSLCGLPRISVDDLGPVGQESIVFFTEYSFAESRFTPADRERFTTVTDADAPDVVIAGPDWLLCIEAKMFHRPSEAALNAQMRRQRILVDHWSEVLELPPERVAHVLLVPEQLDTSQVSFPVVTWQQVLQAFRVVGPAYWTGVLSVALSRYPELASISDSYGMNAEGHLTGHRIVQEHLAGTLGFTHMGRNLGLEGTPLTNDIATGGWRTQTYEVRTSERPGNRNWFPVEEFVVLVTETQPDRER